MLIFIQIYLHSEVMSLISLLVFNITQKLGADTAKKYSVISLSSDEDNPLGFPVPKFSFPLYIIYSTPTSQYSLVCDCTSLLLTPLTNIVNYSLQESSFPSCLQTAHSTLLLNQLVLTEKLSRIIQPQIYLQTCRESSG